MAREDEVDRIREQAQELLAAQRATVRSLLRLRAQLGGSLVMRYAECGKVGWACRSGERHGPYFILSTRSGGRGGFSYLPHSQVSRARTLVEHHREFQEGFRRLKQINEGLLALLRQYRSAAARQGERSLETVAR